VDSWETDYQGNAANVLYDTISVYLAEREVYSQHASIVNSSGTGKSRMVDELGKTVVTVPMCLREPGSNGLICYIPSVWLTCSLRHAYRVSAP
jgi:hypothetical protein